MEPVSIKFRLPMVHQFERDIVNAIENRKSLLVQCHGLLILIDPYVLGMDLDYQHILFGYQTNGEGRGYEAGWVSLRLKEAKAVYTTERKFFTDPDGFEANRPELQIVLHEPDCLAKAV
jgi:hypothetical protein